MQTDILNSKYMKEWMKFIWVLHCNLLLSQAFAKNFLVQNSSMSNIPNAYASLKLCLDWRSMGWLLYVKPYQNYFENNC